MRMLSTFGLALSLAAMLAACGEPPATPGSPELDADAIAVNNRGVGLMGRFEYAEARSVFAGIVEQWPAWHDARINLAIATLNRQEAGDETTALELARQVLQENPDNLRALYVAGLVQLYLGEPAEALAHFRQVAEADPDDAYPAYYTAQCLAQQGDYAAALPWYRKAMQLDPYLRSAYYGAFQSLQRLGRPDEAQLLAADYQRLDNNPRSRLAEFKYTRMGTKGEALAVDLEDPPAASRPEGPLFTGPEPLAVGGGADPGGAAPAAASMTAVDMQGDGFSDLFVAGAFEVASKGDDPRGGNLVLHGQDGGAYSTQPDHPLANVDAVNAALWGDFDNDGLVDVYLCRRGENQLWRQAEADRWENVTASSLTAAGDLDTVDGAFFDADHDGDLDLFLVNAEGPNELLNNNLDGTFRPVAGELGLAGPGSASIMVLPADLDSDRDVDLVVLNREAPHEAYINDRMWSWRPAAGFEAFSARAALAVLAADVDANGANELYTLGPQGELLRWRLDGGGPLQPDVLDASAVPPDAEGAALTTQDVDGDGILDLIVSSSRGWKAVHVNGSAAETIHAVTADAGRPLTATLPVIGDSGSGPAMVSWSAAAGEIMAWPPGPGRYPFVTVTLSGRQDDAQSMRSNASGVGARVSVRTGSDWSVLQNYRRHSGPGQSLQPLAVGLGGARQADFVAIDWSDGVFQSELGIGVGQLHEITETQRQLSSCPVLFAWDGERYAFVSDFLGVGGLGYAVGPNEFATPRPWENFLLPDGALRPKDGRFVLKIGEPMEENAYIDTARLAVYDLPAGWQMVMDERMGISDPQPTGAPVFFRDELLPASATNDRGDDVLSAVLDSEGVAAPVGFLDHRFIGRLDREHVLTLEFPEPLDGRQGAPLLVIDGWVEYPYSQTNFAAWQAGATFEAPTLEAFDGEQWRVVLAQFGYPAGMPRRMSVPLTGLPPGSSRLRLRTNMQIYWDRIAVAFAEQPPVHRRQVASLAAAHVGKTGFARRETLDQFRPHYDYADRSPFWDTRYMAGYYTRLGPVRELVAEHDDAVAIIGPGEEVHLEFDAMDPEPEGWRRYFVLETRGWAKDMDLFTRDGETVGPLPSSGRPSAVRDALHARYNTRYQSGY
jgi:tetratricopeptide (TPR) repeat protein